LNVGGQRQTSVKASAGLFADARLHDEVERFDVTTVAQQQKLMHDVRSALRTT